MNRIPRPNARYIGAFRELHADRSHDAFDELSAELKLDAIKRLSDLGYRVNDIASACRISVNAVRQVLGARA